MTDHREGRDADYWRPEAAAPEMTWLQTRLEGEDGINVCCLRAWRDGKREWIERDGGRTTITHHSFAAPSHWRYLVEGTCIERARRMGAR